jgi:uncharacterized membrane protein
MSQAHIHLLVTHLPVFGSILGAFVLGYGLWSKSNQTKIAAYFLFVISAIGAGVAYLTGEGAEEGVENIQGISKNIIKQHEDAATYALVSLLVLGALALFALFVTYKKSSLIKTTAIASLIFSFISFALVARTGYLGGQIRHSEISSGAVQNTGAGESGVKDDD